MKQKIFCVFEINAAGIDNKSKTDTYLPLVLFCKNMEEKYPTILTGREKSIYHIRQQLRAIDFPLGPEKKLNVICCYEYLTSNWEKLKNRTHTYRLLADLVAAARWHDRDIDPDALNKALRQSGVDNL